MQRATSKIGHVAFYLLLGAIVELASPTATTATGVPRRIFVCEAALLSSDIVFASPTELSASTAAAHELFAKFLVSPQGLARTRPDDDAPAGPGALAPQFLSAKKNPSPRVLQRLGARVGHLIRNDETSEVNDLGSSADLRFGEVLEGNEAMQFFHRYDENVNLMGAKILALRQVFSLGITFSSFFVPLVALSMPSLVSSPNLAMDLIIGGLGYNFLRKFEEGFPPLNVLRYPWLRDAFWPPFAQDTLEILALPNPGEGISYYAQTLSMDSEVVEKLLNRRFKDEKELYILMTQQFHWTATQASFMRHLPPKPKIPRPAAVWILLDILVWKQVGQPPRLAYMIRLRRKRPWAPQTAPARENFPGAVRGLAIPEG